MLKLSEIALMPGSPARGLDRRPHAEIRLGRGLTAQIAASLCRVVAARVHDGATTLALDMTEVERIDSVGLAALHQVGAFATARGIAVSLVPSPALRRALLDAELLEAFTSSALPPGESRTSRSRLPDGMAPGHILASSTNLALRLPTSADLPHFDRWARDPLFALMVGSDLLYRCRHLGLGHPEVTGLILNDPSSLIALVEPSSSLGEPVGFVRLYGIRLISSIAFLETAVTRSHACRRAWGVEASRLLVAYAMDALGLHRIEAKVFAYNTPSINALTRNNFQQEGVLREACLHDGARSDILVFSILEDEVRHQRQRDRFLHMGLWESAPADSTNCCASG